MSSDSFAVGTGFLQTTQSVFSEPPVISSFNLPDIMFKTGQSVLITATLYDLNGINSVELLLQKGAGAKEISIPMFNITDDQYGGNIPDSLLTTKNFRVKKFFGPKNFSGQKIFWIKKNFGSKKLSGQNCFWV